MEMEEKLEQRELEDKRNPRTSLTYFTDLTERSTGLKPTILFDCDGVYKACNTSPYLYVCNGYLNVKNYVGSMDFIKISVSENPEILSFHPPCKIFKKDVLAIYKFIKDNLRLITDLANGGIGTIGFVNSIKNNFDFTLFDEINFPLWTLMDDEERYGCRRVVFEDGTVNFINQDDEIVYPKNNFDYAEPFNKNEDGLIYALVRQGNQHFMLIQPDFSLHFLKIGPKNFQ